MELTALIALLKTDPSGVVAGTVVIAVLVTAYLKWRDSDVSTVTSLGRLQHEHLEALMHQNKQLADDLSELRKQMAGAHEELRMMREKAADSNDEIHALRRQVADLQVELRAYRAKCDNCPGPGRGAAGVAINV